jgi:hypothetical protein
LATQQGTVPGVNPDNAIGEPDVIVVDRAFPWSMVYAMPTMLWSPPATPPVAVMV